MLQKFSFFFNLLAYSIKSRAGFRHVPHVPWHRAPTNWGAPTNEGPRAKADSNKRSSEGRQYFQGRLIFFAMTVNLGVGPLEWGLLKWDPIE
jgi:hypothetical protein